MTLEITFELADEDLDYFRARFDEAREKVRKSERPKILQAARDLLDKGSADEVPQFVRNQIQRLRTVISMVEDDAWDLSAEDRNRIVETLAYFAERNDVIPDDIPGIGLLDDAIAIDLVSRALRHEIEAYRDFSAFRAAETKRRENIEESTDVSKEDWLADRRAALHSRMRERRTKDASSGWHYTLFDWSID